MWADPQPRHAADGMGAKYVASLPHPGLDTRPTAREGKSAVWCLQSSPRDTGLKPPQTTTVGSRTRDSLSNNDCRSAYLGL